MKALTFEQHFKAYEGKEMSLLPEQNYTEILTKYIQTWQKYHDFVSQPFNPEMITELFEGFEKVHDLFYKAYKNRCGVVIIIGLENMRLSIDEILVASPNTPKTLNDFISDCQRAGIELQWKEGVL